MAQEERRIKSLMSGLSEADSVPRMRGLKCFNSRTGVGVNVGGRRHLWQARQRHLEARALPMQRRRPLMLACRRKSTMRSRRRWRLVRRSGPEVWLVTRWTCTALSPSDAPQRALAAVQKQLEQLKRKIGELQAEHDDSLANFKASQATYQEVPLPGDTEQFISAAQTALNHEAVLAEVQRLDALEGDENNQAILAKLRNLVTLSTALEEQEKTFKNNCKARAIRCGVLVTACRTRWASGRTRRPRSRSAAWSRTTSIRRHDVLIPAIAMTRGRR